jgi:sugar phosphate isomerase/epimerase
MHVDRKNFGVCLDIGHVLAYSKVDLEAWFSNLGKYIRYLHLHWNDGRCDEHDIPTNDQLKELRDLIQKYKLNPIITMEYSVENIYLETERIRKHLNT